MCLRNVHIFRCSGKNGRPEIHEPQYTSLCAARDPCPRELWERRVSYFGTACPTCTDPSEVVSSRNYGRITQKWERNLGTKPGGGGIDRGLVAWADRYVNDWACTIDALYDIAAQPFHHMSFSDQVKVFSTLLDEGLCDIKRHSSGYCSCQFKQDLKALFLCNPANALRSATITELWDTRIEPAPVLESVTQHAAGILREQKYDLKHTVDFPPPKDMANRLMLPNDDLLHRRALVADGIREAFASQAKYLGSASNISFEIPQAFDRMFKRLQLVNVIGKMMAEDIGISGERLRLVISRLVVIAREPKGRRWNELLPLERLARRIGEGLVSPEATERIREVMDQKSTQLEEHRNSCLEEIERYQRLRALSGQVAKELSGSR